MFDRVMIIAGDGLKSPVKTKEYLSENYGGNPNLWMKKSGEIDSGGHIVEIHWFENPSIWKVLEKIKRKKDL